MSYLLAPAYSQPMTETQMIAGLCWWCFCAGLLVGLVVTLAMSLRKR